MKVSRHYHYLREREPGNMPHPCRKRKYFFYNSESETEWDKKTGANRIVLLRRELKLSRRVKLASEGDGSAEQKQEQWQIWQIAADSFVSPVPTVFCAS